MMQFSDYAINAAKKSTNKLYQHGAVLIKGNTVVSSGYNTEFIHAEIMAIERCVNRFIVGTR